MYGTSALIGFTRTAHSGSILSPRSAQAGTGPVHCRGPSHDSDCAVQLLRTQEFFVQAEADRRRREIALRNAACISGEVRSDCASRCIGIKTVRSRRFVGRIEGAAQPMQTSGRTRLKGRTFWRTTLPFRMCWESSSPSLFAHPGYCYILLQTSAYCYSSWPARPRRCVPEDSLYRKWSMQHPIRIVGHALVPVIIISQQEQSCRRIGASLVFGKTAAIKNRPFSRPKLGENENRKAEESSRSGSTPAHPSDLETTATARCCSSGDRWSSTGRFGFDTARS